MPEGGGDARQGEALCRPRHLYQGQRQGRRQVSNTDLDREKKIICLHQCWGMGIRISD